MSELEMEVTLESLERDRNVAARDTERLKVSVTAGEKLVHKLGGKGEVLSSGTGDEKVWVLWPSNSRLEIKAWEVDVYFTRGDL